jgi:ABC-type ATPase involved in cell division
VGQLSHAEVPLLRRSIGVVFQDFKLLENLTVYDNVALALRIRGRKEREIKGIVLEALKDIHLRHKVESYPPTLSGGEQQRVALARAFLLDSKVLLLDEPTANLDPNSAAIIEKAILSRKQSDKIIVMATHNLNQAKRLADEIVHIHSGKIVEASAANDFFENPKSEVTRKFINGELDF